MYDEAEAASEGCAEDVVPEMQDEGTGAGDDGLKLDVEQGHTMPEVHPAETQGEVSV